MTTDPGAGWPETRRKPRVHGTAGERDLCARLFAAAVSVGLALAAGGCTLHSERPVALAAPEAPAGIGRVAPPSAGGAARASARADDRDGAVPPAGAIPTPKQIFDFHPPGSRADAWRQPFVIDPNDGPLTNDVRKTAAELKAFLAQPKADRAAQGRRCGENDAASGKPGCVGAPTAQAAARERPAVP